MTAIRSPQAGVRVRRFARRLCGATLAEFVIVAPTALFVLLNLIQYGLLYHTKSQLNYATFEAARAGTTQNADPAKIRAAFTRAMIGYYGGGTRTAELAASWARATADTTAAHVRIEILSPTRESFDDYASPALARKLGVSSRAIPNTNLAFIRCPVDVPGCNDDPRANRSGQTLLDANLLKLRITYGIPTAKQIPLAGRFMNWALSVLNRGDPDAFRAGLVAAGRIPVIAHTVMRMQSPAIENGNLSLPGPGNGGVPEDPGPGPGSDPSPGADDIALSGCPATEPACTREPQPAPNPGSNPNPGCDPLTDAGCAPGGTCPAPPGWLNGALAPRPTP